MPEREDIESLRQFGLHPVDSDASADTVEIVVDEGDHRSGIVDQLKARDDLSVRIEPVDVADYVLSKRVAVNRIRLHPSHNLTDEGVQTLVDQLKAIIEVCSRPVLVLEREHSATETASPVLHEFRARLASDLNLLESGSASETAELLATIAHREQTSTSKSRSSHQGGQARTLAEQQEYVVASITDLGPVTARTLLEHFTSVERVVSASEEELLEVPGIGEELAARVSEVVSSRYRGPPR